MSVCGVVILLSEMDARLARLERQLAVALNSGLGLYNQKSFLIDSLCAKSNISQCVAVRCRGPWVRKVSKLYRSPGLLISPRIALPIIRVLKRRCAETEYQQLCDVLLILKPHNECA